MVGGVSVRKTVVVKGETVVVSSERVWIDVCVTILVSVSADVMGRMGADGVDTLSFELSCLFM